MNSSLYNKIKTELQSRPKQLTDMEQWLFVTVNTAKAMIDNTSKKDIGIVTEFAECESVSQIQQRFDVLQGKFGREGFSERHSRVYIYLCSLVAGFPDREITDKERLLIKEYYMLDSYLLYEL